jgi:hypothetical protein
MIGIKRNYIRIYIYTYIYMYNYNYNYHNNHNNNNTTARKLDSDIDYNQPAGNRRFIRTVHITRVPEIPQQGEAPTTSHSWGTSFKVNM